MNQIALDNERCPTCVMGRLPWNRMVLAEQCICACTDDLMTEFLTIIDNGKEVTASASEALAGYGVQSIWGYALSKGYITRDVLQDLKVVLTRHGKQVLRNTKARVA
tara:strand:+ start:261 stop:581 length:321 start_codon:yes stop_codon:yes gene_type:complete